MSDTLLGVLVGLATGSACIAFGYWLGRRGLPKRSDITINWPTFNAGKDKDATA